MQINCRTMKLSRKFKLLWILLFISINICGSGADTDKDENDSGGGGILSRARFHDPTPEMSCYTRRQQGTCRRRSECRRPTRQFCRFGNDPIVCCLDRVVHTTTKKTTPKPFILTTKRTANVDKPIDLTFPGCGNRSPKVEEKTTSAPSRRGGIFSGRRLGKRDVQSKRYRRWNEVAKPVIVGGREAKSNSWPWMTAIFKTAVTGGPKRFLCGASLISRRYVITAAHCFDGERDKIDPSKFTIVVGSHTTKDGTEYPVSSILLHPGYQKRQYYNDLCVLKVGQDVTLTKKVWPVCLPSDGNRRLINTTNKNAIVTGWGDTTFGGVSSKVLQEVEVPIVPLKQCNASYASVAKANFPRGITDVFLCAGLKEGGKDACQGDSGGPMVNKMKNLMFAQLGVVSFGYGCAQAGYPGVYTRLTSYTKWLYDNTDLGK